MQVEKPGMIIAVLALLLGLAAGALAGYLCAQHCGQGGPQPAVVPTIDLADLSAKVAERLSQQGVKGALPVPAPAVAPVPAPVPTPAPVPPPAPKVEPTPPPMPLPPPEPEVKLEQWIKLAGRYKTEAGESPALGPETALVKVFIISDFQCPVCRRAANELPQLYPQYEGKVQWIFWQNPLPMHPRAMPMAKATMAAAAQGKFWEYHELVFGNQMAELTDLLAFASQLGLDMDKFRADMESPEVLRKLQSDAAAADLIGARGTPSFLINGRLQVGWGSAGGIGSMVDMELKAMEALVKGGMSAKDAAAERVKKNSDTPAQADIYAKHFEGGAVARATPAAAAK